MRLTKRIILFIISFALVFVFAGCAASYKTSSPLTTTGQDQPASPSGDDKPSVYVVSIEKQSSVGLTDRYVVKYSDGSQSVIEINNGKDGENMTVEDAYNAYLERHPDATYDDFLNAFISFGNADDTLAIHKCLRSSLKVYAEFTELKTPAGSGFVRPPETEETEIYSGSAVIYSINSDYTYLITNYHVIYDEKDTSASHFAKKIVCYLYGSESNPVASQDKDDAGCTIYDYGSYAIECELVGGAAVADIAVLRVSTDVIKGVNPDIIAVEYADGYRVGETAIAIGNPGDDGVSVTRGIISVDNEFITISVDGTYRSYRSIRVDTPLYHGSSGGGLFNSDGKLIGITNAGDETDQNINYAVPLDIVKAAVNNILHYGDGTARKITVGVTVQSQNSRYVYDTQMGYGKIVEDVAVLEVSEDSIATALGLQKDDILTGIRVNGSLHTFDRFFTIGDILYEVYAGDGIAFEYIRGGTPATTVEYTVKQSDIKVLE